ncbi:hypothetical protein Golomagni_08311 [Golovinomyces magnicellulatus]|nr:hypothetical protein Golomagni_08311 [Golovinomyces magnicellulatus]
MFALTRIARPLLRQSIRTFTSLAPHRPSLTPLRITSPATATAAPSLSAEFDLVAKDAVSSHPSLMTQQLRFGPRNTMNGHTRLVQKRRHGFLYRMRSRTGRMILRRRKLKGRRSVAA